jgi:DNA (cytosine-5)-methyltransferase 1
MVRKTKRKPKAIDLFSGCGGLSLGLHQAGFHVVGAVDADELASSTYKMNHPDTMVIHQDIRTVDPTKLMKKLRLKPGRLALLAGCPPCQGFSTLKTLNGRKTIDDPMNDLIFEFVRFIRAFQPKTIMIENVPALADDPRLVKFGKTLAAFGYRFRFDVFDAADFGVPQRRRRMILLAAKGERPEFAKPARNRATVTAAIRHLPRPALSADPAHNHVVRRADHVMALIKQIPVNGGSRKSLGESAQLACHKKVEGFTDVYGRMAWAAPAPTITSGCINPSKGRFLHPRQHRAITLREAALLQGFPETYKLDLTRGIYPAALMIGNAFPPQFAKRHAQRLHAIVTRGSAKSGVAARR